MPSDRRVDIGGRRLHMACSGAGTPVVVLEAGLNTTASTWRTVQPAISTDTLVCAYDRAGLGTSDPAPDARRTGRSAAADLFALLRSAALTEPYVLVGTSFGGVVVRLFAHEHPDLVAGVVLVDSSHEDQAQLVAAATPLSTAPARERIDVEASLEEVRADHWQADIPLYVLVAGQERIPGASAERLERIKQLWFGMQQDLAGRSPRGRLIVAEKSGHVIQAEQPDLVIGAIRSALADVRGSSR